MRALEAKQWWRKRNRTACLMSKKKSRCFLHAVHYRDSQALYVLFSRYIVTPWTDVTVMLYTTCTCGTLNMLSRTVGYCSCTRLLANLFCRDKTCLCEEKFPFWGNYGAACVSRFASFLLHANLYKHHKMSSRTLAQLQYRLCWRIQSIKVTRCKVLLSSDLFFQIPRAPYWWRNGENTYLPRTWPCILFI